MPDARGDRAADAADATAAEGWLEVESGDGQLPSAVAGASSSAPLRVPAPQLAPWQPASA